MGKKGLPCHFVTVFCPLFELDMRIGPTAFIPASHHLTYRLPIMTVSDQYPPDETVQAIRSEAKTLVDLGDIQMDCEVGDVVVMDGRLLRGQENCLPGSMRSLAYFSFCRPWYYEWPRSQAEDRFLFHQR